MMPFIHFGKHVFESYTLFINLGTFFSIILCYELLEKYCKSEKYRIKIIVVILLTMIAGILSGRLVKNAFDGGLGDATHFLGRVLLFAIIIPIFMKLFWKDESSKTSAYNICAVFVVTQHFFNRIACLLNGCCGGKTIGGIVFPTQIFEALVMVVLFIFLMLSIYKKYNAYGYTLIFFSSTILISEFFMDYSNVTKIAGMTSVQYASIALIVIIMLEKLFVRFKK